VIEVRAFSTPPKTRQVPRHPETIIPSLHMGYQQPYVSKWLNNNVLRVGTTKSPAVCSEMRRSSSHEDTGPEFNPLSDKYGHPSRRILALRTNRSERCYSPQMTTRQGRSVQRSGPQALDITRHQLQKSKMKFHVRPHLVTLIKIALTRFGEKPMLSIESIDSFFRRCCLHPRALRSFP
jgi:hypothetical protein